MSKMFRANDPLAVQIEAAYLDAWAQLSPVTRDRLRTGVDELTPAEVDELASLPHPLLTLAYWLSNPDGARWNISHTFSEWARSEAPSED